MSDLISREALKKALKEKFDDFIAEGVYDEIDNAPTVEAYPFEQVQELVKLNQQFAEEIEELKKPQGEWIKIGEIGLAYKCNRCGEVDVISTNFCPNCGARMKKGGAE